MLAVMAFAMASARRESEICRLEWRDTDEAARTALVRDGKQQTSIEFGAQRLARREIRSRGRCVQSMSDRATNTGGRCY
jgi:integrase